MGSCQTHSRPIVVYMLHLDQPIGRARHYVGSCFADRLRLRLQDHIAGHGARLTATAVSRGIGFTVVRLWIGQNRALERTIQRRRNRRRDCPLCSTELTLDLEAASLPRFRPRPLPSPQSRSLDWHRPEGT